MSEITITIKSSESKTQISIPSNTSVSVLKQSITEKLQIPSQEIKLIYSGKILKDEDILDSLNVMNGHTVHLVRGKPQCKVEQKEQKVESQQVQGSQGSLQIDPSNNPLASLPFMNPLAALNPNFNPSQNPNQTQTNLNTNQPNPFANLGSNLGTNPMAGLNNPMMTQLFQQMIQNPAFVEQMYQSQPQISQMMTLEQFSSVVRSPMFSQMMSDPSLLGSLGGNFGGMGNFGAGGFGGNFGGMGGVGNPLNFGTPNTNASPNANQNFNPLTPGVAQEPPEVRYQNQLQQLQDMGFYDAAENLRALQVVGGNINAAVEILLRNLSG